LPFSPLHFGDRLTQAIKAKRSPLVVGIDPRANQLPPSLQTDLGDLAATATAFQKFGMEIIDAVADLVPAVKPQAAFFERLGPHGMVALANVCDHAAAAGLMVIMDAKRNDIGATAKAYAAGYLGAKPESAWGCDALTINPYMGFDTLAPFFERGQETGAGVFVLCKTSNSGSDALQSKTTDGGNDTITDLVADEIQRLCEASIGESGYGNAGAVVGATYPQQLVHLRAKMKNSILLVPGFGAQGGSASDVAAAFDENGTGAVINSSRGVIFAYEKEEYQSEASKSWQDAVRQSAVDTVEILRTSTNAGKLA
jgi:orotidine-5'-phosphate decarboxylase